MGHGGANWHCLPPRRDQSPGPGRPQRWSPAKGPTNTAPQGAQKGGTGDHQGRWPRSSIRQPRGPNRRGAVTTRRSAPTRGPRTPDWHIASRGALGRAPGPNRRANAQAPPCGPPACDPEGAEAGDQRHGSAHEGRGAGADPRVPTTQPWRTPRAAEARPASAAAPPCSRGENISLFRFSPSHTGKQSHVVRHHNFEKASRNLFSLFGNFGGGWVGRS